MLRLKAYQGSNYLISRSPETLFHCYSRPTSNCCTDTNKNMRTCCEVRFHQEYFFWSWPKEGRATSSLVSLCHPYSTTMMIQTLGGLVELKMAQEPEFCKRANPIEFWGHGSRSLQLTDSIQIKRIIFSND